MVLVGLVMVKVGDMVGWGGLGGVVKGREYNEWDGQKLGSVFFFFSPLVLTFYNSFIFLINLLLLFVIMK